MQLIEDIYTHCGIRTTPGHDPTARADIMSDSETPSAQSDRNPNYSRIRASRAITVGARKTPSEHIPGSTSRQLGFKTSFSSPHELILL